MHVFLVLSCLIQLEAQSKSPPPCEGTLCQDVCFDLMVEASFFQPFFCFVGDSFLPYQISISGDGADIGSYNILTFNENGFNVGLYSHNPGDTTNFFVYTYPPIYYGCEPEVQIYTYEIQCPDSGTILASGTIGTITIYPDLATFYPIITPSIACSQNLMIIPDICGTLVLEPDIIPIPGCNGEDTQVNWSVDVGFEHPQCTGIIEGTELIFACNASAGDTCDDGNPCTTGDTFNENCICVGEGPTAILDTPLPAASCSEVDVTVTITVDMIPDPEGLGVGITKFNGFEFQAYTLLSPGDPLTFDLDINIPTIRTCTPQGLELFLRLSCPEGSGIIGTLEPIGTITIYPDPSLFTVEIEPAVECDGVPVITAPQCGELVLNVTPPDSPACPAGADGFVEYTFGPGFDVTTQPVCFNVSVLSGQEPITACSNCCPLAAAVTIVDTGPFCNGDITEVCATFETPFETDGQVTINGIDAVAGADQICFQLDLINNGCYNEVQIPFEIFCNDEGLVINSFTPEILVSPDPTNFHFAVFSGDCMTLPYYAPTGNANCYLASSNPVTITEPIDGCPPIDGQVEVDLIYYDENFIPVDVSTFTCDNFPVSAILSQPACDTCDPTTCSISVEISEVVCDNNETPQDGSDDVVTVTITSTGPWTAGDGTTGTNGDTYTFPATLANNALSMMFSVDNETDCETVFTTIANDCDVPAIPTLSQWGLIILCLLMMSFGAIKMTARVKFTGRLNRQ